jgi:hypothetical protein
MKRYFGAEHGWISLQYYEEFTYFVDDVASAARRDGLAVRFIHNAGGTAWLWARPEFEDAVDVLFVDEAGQMSLANVLAVSHAAKSIVLLGDPQQLEQPQQGSHPEGTDVSAAHPLSRAAVRAPMPRARSREASVVDGIPSSSAAPPEP